MRLRRACQFCFRRKKIDNQSQRHCGKSPKRRPARGGFRQEMLQHPEADREKDERRDWVTPGAVRARKLWPFPAQDKNAQHSEGRTKGEAELDVIDGGFKR